LSLIQKAQPLFSILNLFSIICSQMSHKLTIIVQYHLPHPWSPASHPVSPTLHIHLLLSDCSSIHLKLSSWFGTRHSLAKLPSECRSLTVYSSVIQCADIVRDFGVLCWTANYPCGDTSSARSSAVFLPSETPASDTELCQPRRHGTTFHLTSRLL